MLAIAGAMALALSLIGIYGVISYAVSQRTREIGIRLALGAQKGVLRWMFVRSALVLTGVGVIIGLGAAAALMRLMKTLLFGISPLDPLTFVAVPVILGDRGCACKLSAGSPRCGSRSSGSAESGVTGTAALHFVYRTVKTNPTPLTIFGRSFGGRHLPLVIEQRVNNALMSGVHCSYRHGGRIKVR